jgi:hypothetical protein
MLLLLLSSRGDDSVLQKKKKQKKNIVLAFDHSIPPTIPSPLVLGSLRTRAGRSMSSCCFSMFSSSVRRAARLPALPTSSSQSGAAVRASGGRLPALIAHQPRRYSSSKPPVPPSDGSRGIDTSSQTPSKGVNPSNGDKREGKSKRHGSTANRSKHDAFMNLPSVPSTQHLHPPGELFLLLLCCRCRLISRSSLPQPLRVHDS